MIRAREDRLFARYRRKGDRRALAELFDRTAPELWRVATHLARDPGLVEDAVQGTFLVAIDDAGSWDARRPVMPWLLGILTNQVRTLVRRRAQRLEGERLAGATGEDPVAAAAAAELRDGLAAALARVAQPYRAVLEQHLLHGSSPAEIAAAFGVRDGTVRMRLHRGLAQLRRLLPAGFAAAGLVATQLPAARLAAVRGVVLAHEAPIAAATVGAAGGLTTLISIVAMHKLLASLSAAAVVMALTWWSMGGTSTPVAPPPTDPGATLRTESTVASPTVGVPAATDPVDANRTPVVARDARPRGKVRVRIVEAGSLRPVPDVALEWRGRIVGRGLTDAAGEWVAEDTVGRARVELPYVKVEHPCEVVADRETLTVIELPVRVRATLTVVDAEGRPLAGARIWGTVREGHLRWDVLGHTDADGRFAHAWVYPRAEVWAVADGLAPSPSLAANEQTPHLRRTIVLREPAGTVTGRVVDAAGAGAAALVAIQETDARQRRPPRPILTYTDADGRFSCRSVPPGPLRIFALHNRRPDAGGFLVPESTGRVDATLVAATPLDVEIRLAGAHVFVQAVGAVSASGRRGWVTCTPDAVEGNLANELARSSGLDELGHAELTGVVPGPTILQVTLGDRIVTEAVDLAVNQTLTWRPVLAAEGSLRLRLLDRQEQSLVGWRVEAWREPRDSMVPYSPLVAETDAEGRATLLASAAATYEIVALRPNVADGVNTFPGVRPLADEQTLRPEEAEGAKRPGTVLGRVMAGEGPLPGGLRVALQRVRNGTVPDESTWAPVAADGSFSIPRVPPGDYFGMVMHGKHAVGGFAPRALAPGGTLDVGAVEISLLGKLTVHVQGQHRTLPLTLAIRPEGVWLEMHQGDATPLEVNPFPAGAWDLLVWGEEIAPAQIPVQVTPGGSTSAEVTPTSAVPCTFALGEGVRHTAHRFTIRAADGREVVSFVPRIPPDGELRRGLLPGQYTVEIADRDAHVLATAPLTVSDGRPRVALGAK